MKRSHLLSWLLAPALAACMVPLHNALAAHKPARRPAQRHGRNSISLTSRAAVMPRGTTSRGAVPAAVQPVPELRAMWVVRDSISSPAKIRGVVSLAKAYGYNALFVQVRGRGDAWYNSSLEPRAEELAGQPPSFDPLQETIQQAHATGIQVHAWLNTYYVWSAGTNPKSPDHVVNAHPEWMACSTDGGFQMSASSQCEGAFLSPSNEAVRRHLHDVFLDVATRYDVDGIHFDYVRYPNKSYDFSAPAEAAFAALIRPTLTRDQQAHLVPGGDAAYVRAFPDAWADWRRNQVTSLVDWISKDVKDKKPWVCVSAAVFADYSDAYTNRGQDWKRWLRDGALDAVIPMAYGSSTALVAEQVHQAEDAAHESGRACYAGLGSWHISAASTAEKIAAARSAGVQGLVLFSYGGMTDDGTSTTYLSRVHMSSFDRPAILPSLATVGQRGLGEDASASVPASESAPTGSD